MMEHDRRTRRRLLAAMAACALARGLPAAGAPQGRFADRPEVREWVRRTAAERGVPGEWMLEVLSEARHVASSKSIMSRPARTASSAPSDYLRHRERFVDTVRVHAGRTFLLTHRMWFEKAQERWGVPPEIVAAVLGVESVYGLRPGRYVTVDVLATLSFDYLRRAEYFRKELAAFLALCHANGVDPRSVRGSFAGAVGMCQFMPRSIERWGTDLDGDGRVDLSASVPDGIGSVASYLASHGWQKDLPCALECTVPEAARKLARGAHRPDTTMGELLAAGVRPAQGAPKLPADTPVFLVRLPVVEDGKPGAFWRIATRSYGAILRYNPAYFYAQSVVDLAQELAA